MKGLIVLLCCVAYCFAQTCPQSYTLTKFNSTEADTYNARCIDGSPFAFWHSLCDQSTNKLIIWMQGGGFCIPDSPAPGLLQDCKTRFGTYSGSSDSYTNENYPSLTTVPKVFLSRDATANPDFYNWDMVELPYCSGDLFSGTATSAYYTFGIWQSGHLNVAALIQKLIEIGVWNQYTDIIVAGESAGGLGVVSNVQYIKTQAPNAQVVAFPEAGYFVLDLPYPGIGLFNSTVPFGLITNRSKSYVNQECAQVLFQNQYPASWSCLQPAVSYPFWGVRSFIAQNIYDSYQLFSISFAPSPLADEKACNFALSFGRDVFSGLATPISTNSTYSGIYAPSCIEHVLNELDNVITASSGETTTEIKLLGDWFNQRANAAFPDYKAIDPCARNTSNPGYVQCNPTCIDPSLSAKCEEIAAKEAGTYTTAAVSTTSTTGQNSGSTIAHSLAFIVACLISVYMITE